MSQPSYEPYLPEVSLHFRPEDLTPTELGAMALAQEANDDPKHAIHHALLASQLWMSRNLTDEIVKGTLKYDQSGISVAADTLWQLYFPLFQRATGPALASTYLRALAQAKAGDIDEAVVYALATEHAKRMGDYFHETSRDAMVQGFNAYVNRKVPARAAAERVMMAYGLTPRQMSGLVSLEPEKAVSSSLGRDLKAKMKAYIGASLRQRLKVFSLQEEHNLDEQAKQFAWMWMVDHGKMSPDTEKVWFTAKDERVCPICGPLHGRSVPVTEPFVTEDGAKFWVPGVHVNCRCWVKTRVPRRALESVSKADDEWDPREHPRGGNPANRGQFSRAPRRSPIRRAPTRPFAEPEEVIAPAPGFEQIMRDLAARTEPISEAEVHVAPPTPTPVSIKPPSAIRTTTPVSIAQPVEITQETQAVSITPTRQGLSIGEEVAPMIGEELRPVFIDTSTSPYTGEIPKPVKPKRVRQVPQVVPLQEPVFAMMTPDDMDLFVQTGDMQFAHDREFNSDELSVVAQAASHLQFLKHDKYEKVTSDGQVTSTIYLHDDVSGGLIKVRVPPEQVNDIIDICTGVASGEVDELDSAATTIMVEEFDEHDIYMSTRKYSAVDVGHELGISPDDFRMGIMRLDRVHDSQRAGSYNYRAQRPGQNRLTVSGKYTADLTVEPEDVPAGMTHGNRIPIYELEPYDPEIFEIEEDD